MIREASRERVEESPDSRRDRRLRRSRRVDWRFLLPEPALGRVGLVGPVEADLVESLREFADSLVLLEEDGFVGPDLAGTCDVVVLRSTTTRQLERAAHLAKDGGTLYWEIDHAPGLRLAVARVRLARLGFAEARFHWHRPTFASCREIVPLHDGAVLDWVLGRRPGSPRGAIRLACHRLLRRLGGIAWMTRCRSCVALKRGGRGRASA